MYACTARPAHPTAAHTVALLWQVWERKRDGGFPEAKVLKQRVRDVITPTKDLGHSECTPTAPPTAAA
jgi:predicted Rdx family selenoprotein